MNTSAKSSLLRHIGLFSLIFAPLCTVVGQFFWHHGVLGITAGIWQVYSYFFWIFAFHLMFQQLETPLPRYASIGFFVAVFSCIGGNNFGVEGIYSELMEVRDLAALDTLHTKLGGAAAFYLFLPGLLFPLSLLVLGINLIRTKTIPMWIGVLFCVSAIGFPLSRIPRIDLIAHLDNLLLLISHTLVAWQITTQGKSSTVGFSALAPD
jgi:hypothetical protein